MTRAELEAALAWADWLARSKDPGPALAMAKVTDRLKEQYARVAGNPRGDITGGGEMSGTNPGAWPDQEPIEPQMSRYTAADLKAARLETVERCMDATIEAMQRIREEINES